MSYRAAMAQTAGVVRADDLAATLSTCARELYEDPRLVPLLRRLMTTSCTLTGSVGSSISIVDPAAGRYTKVAERGTACRLGQSFPLDEGVTGRVMASRRPIVLASYRDVATGHLPPQSRARDGAVAAIPIWWRGDVIGANVVFAGCSRTFSSEEIDQLEVVTQVVAPGIVTAAGRDLAMADLFRRAAPPDVRERARAGSLDPSSASVAEVARGLASLVARAALPEQGAWTPVQVRVLYDEAVLRLQVRGGSDRRVGWQELVDGADGAVQAVLAGALGRPHVGTDGPDEVPSPFTAREQQVAALLSQGLSDRAIADALLISPKTAEKHVGAVLRKTRTTSRTAAVVRALERGWLAEATTTTP
jgi:DNA-binding CsgD family transcriptional regulator